MMQPTPEVQQSVNAEPAEPAKIKHKNYHKPGYMREYMRKRRAAQKAAKEAKNEQT